MLTTEQQLTELDRVVAMCKGTKLEGKEVLCVKWYDDSYGSFKDYTKTFCKDSRDIQSMIVNHPRHRIFTIAIVEDTPIFLEEPFTLTHPQYQGKFAYNKTKHSLDTLEPVYQLDAPMLVSIPIKNVRWSEFRLYREKTRVIYTNSRLQSTGFADTRQVGGGHYKNKAIQPWDYMQANYPREQFIGFLRGNIQRYIDRYRDKNGVEDLQKAIHYLEKLVEVESKDKNETHNYNDEPKLSLSVDECKDLLSYKDGCAVITKKIAEFVKERE